MEPAMVCAVKPNEALETSISYVPEKFSITITCHCNLRCPSCQYLLQEGNFFDDSGHMPFEQFKYILDKFRSGIKKLTITGGEPTLHPELEKFIDYSQSLNIDVGFPTNGTLITKKLEIFRKVSGHFHISLDAYDEESFLKNRGGTKHQWNLIRQGIDTLKENDIAFDVSFLLSRDNIADIYRMIDFCNAVRPRLVKFHSINPHHGPTDVVLNANRPEVVDVLNEVTAKDDYPYNIVMPYVFDESNEFFSNKICCYPWDGVYIGEKGDIAYCCQLVHDSKIGNIFRDYDFNSDMMITWRSLMLNGRLPRDCKFCHRRFMGHYVHFDRKEKRWIYPADSN